MKKYTKKYIIITNDSNVKGTMWLNRTNYLMFLINLVEFGIFFLFFLIILFFFVFNKKIMQNNLPAKCLIISILFSQIFLRGSGFFIGSFLFCSFIILKEVLKKKNLFKNNT